MKILLCLVLLFFSLKSFSGGDSFQISPAPIAHPSYQEGEKPVLKTTGTYISMEGQGLELSGIGFTMNSRTVGKSLERKGAFHTNLGLNVLSGNYQFASEETSSMNFDLTMLNFNFEVGLEYQIIKTEMFSLIGFGGFTFPMFFLFMEGTTNDPVYTNISATGSGFLYGFPFGFQAGYSPTPNWTFAPFAVFNWMLGGTTSFTMTIDTISAGGAYSTESESSSNVDGYFAPSYGMDIIYEPYNISLGMLLQKIDSGGEAGGIETQTYQVSWRKEF